MTQLGFAQRTNRPRPWIAPGRGRHRRAAKVAIAVDLVPKIDISLCVIEYATS